MKNKEILKNYLYWFLTFLGCMLIGIIRTYALSFTDFTDVHSNTTLYVGYANSGNPISWPYNNSTLYQSNIISLDYVVNTNITGGVHYEFESHMLRNFIINNPIYSVVDANGNTCLTDSYYLNFINGEYPRWDFQCPSNSTGFTIHIQQSNSSKLFNEGYMGWGSAILSKTDIPISSISDGTEEIINNNNYNTNQIIDNQNQNTDRIIDELSSCRDSVNLLDLQNGTYTTYGVSAVVSNGVITLNNTATQTAFIEIPLNSSLQWTSSQIYSISAFNSSTNDVRIRLNSSGSLDLSLSNTNAKSTFTYTNQNDMVINHITIRVQSGTTLSNFVIKPQLQKGNPSSNFEVYGTQICSNKIDETTNSINDLNDNITSDNVDDSSIANAFNDFNDYLDDNSTITQLLTLPITLFTAILNNVNGTCQPFNLGALYGEDLIFPCINVSQYLGNTLWSMIDIIISGFAIFAISKKMIKVFNNFSSLKEGDVIDD